LLCGELLDIGLRMGVMKMCKVFRRIYTKVHNPNNLSSLEHNVTKSMTFLHSFFHIMTHLPYHLIQELDICGLVSICLTYMVEIHIKILKSYVHNMARSEASMVEGYLRKECIWFVIKYLITKV